jgi:RNA polymerase sigma-70 factor (subfamily 1)
MLCRIVLKGRVRPMQDRLSSNGSTFQIDRLRIERAKSGSKNLRIELLEACRPYLLMVANQELDSDLRPRVAPSDLVQESIIAADQDFEKFKGEDERALFAWLSVILQHRIVEAVRRHKRTKRRSVEKEVLAEYLENLAEARADSTPSALLMALEEESRLHEAIQKLKERQRRVIYLKCWEKKKLKEIGAELGISEDAAGKVWSSAVMKLTKELRRLGET